MTPNRISPYRPSTNRPRLDRVWVAALCLGLGACDQPPPDAEGGVGEARVVVYTSRQPHLVAPLFERFTASTGVVVDYTSDSDAALIERLAAEGPRSPADVLMTVDAGNLWFAAERGVLAATRSQWLEDRIPQHLRDPDGHWFGLSLRARTLVYHRDRVDPRELSTYEALADDKWAGRLCLRTSRKVYNQSLVAMLIEHHGTEEAERIVTGWVRNLAAQPYSSDTQVIEAIAAGQCDVGLVNSYYLGRLQLQDPDYPVALFWANQAGTGVHINISGAGVTRHAPRPARAIELLEWLASDVAQQEFAAVNLEMPVVDGVELAPVVAAWGPFASDSTPLSVVGSRQIEAVRLIDRAGWR